MLLDFVNVEHERRVLAVAGGKLADVRCFHAAAGEQSDLIGSVPGEDVEVALRKVDHHRGAVSTDFRCTECNPLSRQCNL